MKEKYMVIDFRLKNTNFWYSLFENKCCLLGTVTRIYVSSNAFETCVCCAVVNVCAQYVCVYIKNMCVMTYLLLWYMPCM